MSCDNCNNNCEIDNPYVRDSTGGNSNVTYSTAPGIHSATLVMVKILDDFPFRGINAGPNMLITQNTNDVTFAPIDSLQISYNGGRTITLNSGPVLVNTTNILPATQFINYIRSDGITIHSLSNDGQYLNGGFTQVQTNGLIIPAPGVNNNDPYKNDTLLKVVNQLPNTTLYTGNVPTDTVQNYHITGVLKSLGAPVVTNAFDIRFKAERTGAGAVNIVPGSVTVMGDINEPTLTPSITPGATSFTLSMINPTNPGFQWNGSLDVEYTSYTLS
jgi:hypothetical protein